MLLLFLVIPIFGVLTHKDKIDPDGDEYQTLEKEFKEGLGLQDNRFLLCTSYCDDYDKLRGKSRLDQRHPELDIPILRFMQQVSVHLFMIGDFDWLIDWMDSVLWRIDNISAI